MVSLAHAQFEQKGRGMILAAVEEKMVARFEVRPIYVTDAMMDGLDGVPWHGTTDRSYVAQYDPSCEFLIRFSWGLGPRDSATWCCQFDGTDDELVGDEVLEQARENGEAMNAEQWEAVVADRLPTFAKIAVRGSAENGRGWIDVGRSSGYGYMLFAPMRDYPGVAGSLAERLVESYDPAVEFVVTYRFAEAWLVKLPAV